MEIKHKRQNDNTMTRDELKAALVGRTIRRTEEIKIEDLRAFKNFDGKTAYKVRTERFEMIFNEETLLALLDGVTVGETFWEYELDRVMTMKQIKERLIGKTLVESYQWEDDEPVVGTIRIEKIEDTGMRDYAINDRHDVLYTSYQLQLLAVNGEFNSTTQRFGKKYTLKLKIYDNKLF